MPTRRLSHATRGFPHAFSSLAKRHASARSPNAAFTAHAKDYSADQMPPLVASAWLFDARAGHAPLYYFIDFASLASADDGQLPLDAPPMARRRKCCTDICHDD